MTNILFYQIGVVVFLLCNLYIGFRSGQGVKTLKDYALANHRLPMGALVATLIATLMDSNLILIRVNYGKGVIAFLHPLFLGISALVLGFIFFPKLYRFQKEYTIAEIMGTIYGPSARFCTVLVATLFSLPIMIGQLLELSSFAHFIGMAPNTFTFLMGAIIIFYTAFGGVRSVAKTDIFQFLVVFLGLFLFFLLVVYPHGGPLALFGKLSNHPKLDFWGNPELLGRVFQSSFWSVVPALLISPAVIQRVLIPRNRASIRSIFLSFSVVFPFLAFLMLMVGLSLLLHPGFLVQKNQGVGEILTILCAHPIGHLAFFLSIFALVMSTIDSFLNSLSILWVHDFILPLLKKANIKKDPLHLLYGSTFCLGFLTLFGYAVLSFTSMELGGYAIMLYSAISLPFVLGVWGLKGDNRLFFTTLGAYYFSFVFIFLLFCLDVYPVVLLVVWIKEALFMSKGVMVYGSFLILRAIWLIALLVGAVVFLGGHYMRNGGFVFLRPSGGTWVFHKNYRIRDFFSWGADPLGWMTRRQEGHERRIERFAFFALLYHLIPPLGNGGNLSVFSFLTLGILQAFGLFWAVILLSKAQWPALFKPYFYSFYYLFLLYTLPFLGTLKGLSGAMPFYGPLMMVMGIFLLGILVDGRSFFLLQGMGLLLAFFLFFVCSGNFLPEVAAIAWPTLFWMVGASILLVLLFLSPMHCLLKSHKERIESEEAIRGLLLASYQDGHRQLADSLHKNSSMMKVVQRASDQLRQEGCDPKKIEAIQEAVAHFSHLSVLSRRFLHLEFSRFFLDDLLDDALRLLKSRGIDPESSAIFLQKNIENVVLVGDRGHLARMLAWDIDDWLAGDGQEGLTLQVDAALLSYDVGPSRKKSLQPALRFFLHGDLGPVHPPKAPFFPDQEERSQGTHRSLVFLQNRRIVEMHHGYLGWDGDRGAHTYVVPLDLFSIDPRIKGFAKEDLAGETTLDSSQDQSFLKNVRASGLQVGVIEEALRVAKYYHQGQKRKDGTPYYWHPLAVARILMDQGAKEGVVVAGLLHDILEDTVYTTQQLRATFGANVERIVRQVTHLYGAAQRPKIKLDKKETIQRLIKEGHREALLVKLADRLHNIETLSAHKNPEKEQKIAKETRDLFLPMARQIGEDQIAQALEKHMAPILKKSQKK